VHACGRRKHFGPGAGIRRLQEVDRGRWLQHGAVQVPVRIDDARIPYRHVVLHQVKTPGEDLRSAAFERGQHHDRHLGVSGPRRRVHHHGQASQRAHGLHVGEALHELLVAHSAGRATGPVAGRAGVVLQRDGVVVRREEIDRMIAHIEGAGRLGGGWRRDSASGEQRDRQQADQQRPDPHFDGCVHGWSRPCRCGITDYHHRTPEMGE